MTKALYEVRCQMRVFVVQVSGVGWVSGVLWLAHQTCGGFVPGELELDKPLVLRLRNTLNTSVQQLFKSVFPLSSFGEF